jgi:hypothetical protein
MKEKPIKFDEESKLIITEDAGEREAVDLFSGEVIKQKLERKYEATQEVSLGSINNPNKKIRSFKYIVPIKQTGVFGWWKK